MFYRYVLPTLLSYLSSLTSYLLKNGICHTELKVPRYLFVSSCHCFLHPLSVPPFRVVLMTPIDSVLHEKNFHYYDLC